MRIANNIMAMNTHRQYTINNNAVSKSAEKLSSGYRINRAGDDAAGLAISEKMRSQIRGLNMASKNSQDGNSLIQTAEGALQEVHSMLQRMNELAVQSASGTNQEIDRQALDLEFGQLVEEIDQISQQTTFNDMELFTGQLGAGNTTYAGLGKAAAGAVAGEKFAGLAGATVISHTGVSAEASTIEFEQGSYNPATDVWTAGTGTGDKHVKVTYTADNGDVRSEIIDLKAAMTDEDGNAIGTGATVAGKTYNINLGSLGTYKVSIDAGATVNNLSTDKIAAALEGTAGTTVAAGAGAGGNLKIQVGAKKGETMEIGIDKMDATTLGVKSLDINSQASAGTAIETVRAAVNTVSSQRARLGAAQNRLEHKIANLDTSAENLSAAESRIRDVDLASEMTNFTKNNILSQAATAMLAQANTIPQNVLQLLR